MLACHEENYEMVKMLIVRGQTIVVPSIDKCKYGNLNSFQGTVLKAVGQSC